MSHFRDSAVHSFILNFFQLSVEDARESVAHVSKFLRATREVAREGGRDKSAPRDGSRDAFLEAALRKKLEYDASFQVWLPPF